VRLATNQKLTVEMTATAGTDFDLWLWKPGSTTVYDSNPNPRIANASQTRGTSTESFWYPASFTGTYYLDVFSDKATSPNKGPYRLLWVVKLMTWACPTGLGSTPAATIPEMCEISAIR